MSETFKMPDPGEGVHEVEIVEVHVSPGDRVEDGDRLFSIETDKAAIDIPAPFDGEIEAVEVSDGDRAQVGDVLLRYSQARSEPGRDDAEQAEGREGPAAGEASSGVSDDVDERSQARGRAGRKHKGTSARDDGNDAARREDGGGGRAGAHSGDSGRESGKEPRGSSAGYEADGPPARAAPSTRRLARELGVDLARIEGSGPGGRVLSRDVEAAAPDSSARREREDAAAPERAKRRAEPDADEERRPLTGIRRATAERLSRAWKEIPHVTHEDLVDITELEQLRQRGKETVERAGGTLTITALAVKALASALREFPRFNASLDDGEIVLHRDCHVGIAVDTESGLLVPVIRNADRKSVLEIAVEARELSERARARELERRELRGGTITITNPGGIGGARFTPLINPPQAAILGLARARLMPVVRGGLDDARVEPRLMLPVMLTFDHRLNDGADAARLVNRIADILSAPQSFILRV